MSSKYKKIMNWDDTGFLLSKIKYNENSLITEFYISSGKSKKDAEQNAAILCLNDIN